MLKLSPSRVKLVPCIRFRCDRGATIDLVSSVFVEVQGVLKFRAAVSPVDVQKWLQARRD